MPLCTFAGSPKGVIDNVLAPCDSTLPGYGIIRIEGYAPPAGTAGTEPITQYINAATGHHGAADAAWAANATAAGFTASGVIGLVLSTGPPVPPAPVAQDYYIGILTRLEALLGDSLTYYWSWTPEGW